MELVLFVVFGKACNFALGFFKTAPNTGEPCDFTIGSIAYFRLPFIVLFPDIGEHFAANGVLPKICFIKTGKPAGKSDFPHFVPVRRVGLFQQKFSEERQCFVIFRRVGHTVKRVEEFDAQSAKTVGRKRFIVSHDFLQVGVPAVSSGRTD